MSGNRPGYSELSSYQSTKKIMPKNVENDTLPLGIHGLLPSPPLLRIAIVNIPPLHS